MTNLVSYKTFRRPLFSKSVSWLGLFFLPFLSARRLYFSKSVINKCYSQRFDRICILLWCLNKIYIIYVVPHCIAPYCIVSDGIPKYFMILHSEVWYCMTYCMVIYGNTHYCNVLHSYI